MAISSPLHWDATRLYTCLSCTLDVITVALVALSIWICFCLEFTTIGVTTFQACRANAGIILLHWNLSSHFIEACPWPITRSMLASISINNSIVVPPKMNPTLLQQERIDVQGPAHRQETNTMTGFLENFCRLLPYLPLSVPVINDIQLYEKPWHRSYRLSKSSNRLSELEDKTVSELSLWAARNFWIYSWLVYKDKRQ